MNNNFEKMEEAISRATSEKERDELKGALFDLRAQSARHVFENEIVQARDKALRRKLLPVKVLGVITVIATVWWHAALFLDNGHYTKRHQLITFADRPILYTIHAVAWVSFSVIAMVFLYWIVKLILIDRQNKP